MSSEQHLSIIIVAGGKGLRAGGEIPKQFQLVGNKPMLMRTIEAFYTYNHRMQIVVVLAEEFHDYWRDLCSEYHFRIAHTIVGGGETRFHSVQNGLQAIDDKLIVGIHDAARPFVSQEVIGRCFQETYKHKCGVIPVIDEKNSIRQIMENGSKNIDRNSIKIVQTPQVFPADKIKEAYQTHYDASFTDDTSVADKVGMKIILVQGDEENIKITTPIDFAIGELILRNQLHS